MTDIPPDHAEGDANPDLAATPAETSEVTAPTTPPTPCFAPAWRLPPATLRVTIALVAAGALGGLFTGAPWRTLTPPPALMGPQSLTSDALRTGYRINVNTADVDELRLLPGVGPITAERIVEHREAHGPFSHVDDLDAVHGIGPRTLMRLAPHITVEAEPERGPP